MKLYSVWIGWDYEGDNLILLTESLEKAEECKARLKAQERWDHVYWSIEETERENDT